MYHIVSLDGILLKEVNRLLRPKGYFVYSAPPAYRKDKDYPVIWNKLVDLTTGMCWKLIARKVQTAIWVKEEDPSCLKHNAELKVIDICDAVDETKASWKTPLMNCIQLAGAITATKKLPPRPERLSVYSESLNRIGQFSLHLSKFVLRSLIFSLLVSNPNYSQMFNLASQV